MNREAATDATCLEYINQTGKILFDYCRTNNLQSKKWVAIIGDSHAHVLFRGFSEEFEKIGLGTIVLANSSCPPFIGTATGATDAEMELCTHRIKQILSILVQEKHIEKVLIVTRGPVYITGNGFGPAEKTTTNIYIKTMHDQEKSISHHQIFFNGLSKTIDFITRNDKKVYYFLENPELGMLPKNCLGRPLTFKTEQPECNVDLSVYKSRMSDYRAGAFEMRNNFPALLILDPESLFCDQQTCRTILDDKLLYADDDHLSIEGSRLVAKEFMSTIVPNIN